MMCKPYYQEPNHMLYCGHALDILGKLPSESIDMVMTLNKQRRVAVINAIQGVYFIKEQVFLFDNFRVNNTVWPVYHLAPPIWSNYCANCFSWQTFKFPKFNKQFCLWLFNSQIWKQTDNTIECLLIGNSPCVKWFAMFRRWFFYSVITAKMFVQKIRDIWSNLFQPYSLRINWLPRILAYPHVIGASFNREITIRINTTRKISLQCLFHSAIISYSVAGDKYI